MTESERNEMYELAEIILTINPVLGIMDSAHMSLYDRFKELSDMQKEHNIVASYDLYMKSRERITDIP